MQRSFIHVYAYSILILLSTAITADTIFISLLLLSTDKLLRASLFPGAELTAHLLKLINILWLPWSRINKSGFYFPRILLRSPILVGHQPLAAAAQHGSRTRDGIGKDRPRMICTPSVASSSASSPATTAPRVAATSRAKAPPTAQGRCPGLQSPLPDTARGSPHACLVRGPAATAAKVGDSGGREGCSGEG
jgi:hypothetical protein